MFCILIDDDLIFNYIHEKTIRNVCSECIIKSFLSSRQALEYIIQNSLENPSQQLHIFLDINMPEFNGFEFLDKLQDRAPELMEKYNIYILTSSLNEKDKKKAALYPTLKGYLEKPLQKDQLSELLKSNL